MDSPRERHRTLDVACKSGGVRGGLIDPSEEHRVVSGQ